jgi:uncharacterized low-complexity protein
MITKLIGVATLFTAGSFLGAGSPAIGATAVEGFAATSAFTMTGSCGAGEAKEDGKAPDKAKEGSCGKGSCGSKDKKAKKDGSCGKGSCGSKDKKAKKDGSCGKDHKDGSCGKDKKEAEAK